MTVSAAACADISITSLYLYLLFILFFFFNVVPQRSFVISNLSSHVHTISIIVL